MSKDMLVLYGAYGYTGKLIIEECLKLGLNPLLSGRNEDALQAVSKQYNLPYETVSLEDKKGLDRLLAPAKVVIHAAGPFIYTSRPMAEACLRQRTHYLDITGEYAIFENLYRKHEEAKSKQIMLLPGAGFDVVPTDCLAAHLADRMPEASQLQLAFAGLSGGLSRGTAHTMVEGMGYGGAIRANHRIEKVITAYKVREIDFGEKILTCVTIPWGDISTAYRSTGIANIEVYTAVKPSQLNMMRWSTYFDFFLRTRFVKDILHQRINQRPPGPDENRRQQGKTLIWGRVNNGRKKEAISLMQCPEGYTLTALTAADIAHRVMRDDFKVGYQTPSLAYGADYILQFSGVSRQDVALEEE